VKSQNEGTQLTFYLYTALFDALSVFWGWGVRSVEKWNVERKWKGWSEESHSDMGVFLFIAAAAAVVALRFS